VSYFTLGILIPLMEIIKALYISAHSDLRDPRQEFALNLSAKRRLCNTVGGRIGRIVEGCAAYRCAVTAARSRARTMTNFARSSLVLMLRAFFGGAKSCALVNFFMISAPGRLVTSPTTTKILPPDPGLIMALRDPFLDFGSQSRGERQRFDQPPFHRRPPARLAEPVWKSGKNPREKDFVSRTKTVNNSHLFHSPR
jgi:hypothetical protein